MTSNVTSDMMSTIRIVILGDHKVGKSDLMYRSSIRLEDTLTDIEILDTCTKPGQMGGVHESRISWADAVVIVYSILNRRTFHTAKALIESISRVRTSTDIPIMLLGNMADIEHRREVGTQEGYQVALEFGCQYFEVSAAENIQGINLAFQSFLKEAKFVQQQKNTLTKRRKSSLSNMSKRLGAMFSKKDSNGVSNIDTSGPRRSSVDVKEFAKS